MVYAGLFFGITGALLIALGIQKRFLRVRSIARGLLITDFTLLLGFAGGEFYFRYIYANSENVSNLATTNWVKRYYHTNSLGFRDREWTPADLQGKTTVLLTGDSLAAGWGINDPADRYGDVLAQHLGDKYAVINLGIYGTDTAEQTEILKNYPLKTANVVIMEYFLNDIDYAGLTIGLHPPLALPEPSWMQTSYLIDYLWGHIFSRILDPEFNDGYWAWNYAAYDNYVIWDIHKKEIEDYVNYVDSMHARLIVVIFPNLLDPVGSIPYVDRVAQEIQSTGHNEILKLFDQAAAMPLEERIVSPLDAHPSIAFDRIVGDQLYQQFFQNQPQSASTSEPTSTAQPASTRSAATSQPSSTQPAATSQPSR